MFMPARSPSSPLPEQFARLLPYRPRAPWPGLLSPETWEPSAQDDDPREWRLMPMRRAADPSRAIPPEQPPVVLAARNVESRTQNDALPDPVVNSFRDRLDADGLRFLKEGPVASGQRRAYGQRVHPDAHLSAAMAPADLQRRFQDTGRFDRTRYFAGPDDTLYVRDAGSREMLAQRLRRGMERAVGKRSDAPPVTPRANQSDSMLARDASMTELHRATNRWPHLYREAERRKSILDDTPALFDIVENSEASAAAPLYALHGEGYKAVKAYDRIVEEEARRVGLDPDLARAVMYVENAQGWYGGLVEDIGKASSIFPMNINPKLWGQLGIPSGGLEDERSNIRAGVTLLKRIEDRLEDPTIEKLATLYNNGAADYVNDYGARAASVYRNRTWSIFPQYLPGRGPVPKIP